MGERPMNESIINEMLPRFEARIFQGSESKLNYRIHLPRTEPGVRYPLLLIMHGAGSIGTNNQAQLFLTGLFCRNPLLPMEHCIVLAPQCQTGAIWVENEGTWDGRHYRFRTSPTAPLKAVIELVTSVMAELPVDYGNVMIGGCSMGGYATWDLLSRMPGLFARAFPICGAGDPAMAGLIAGTEVWAFHGVDDTSVHPEASRRMVRRLYDIGANVRYTEFPGVGHASWLPAAKHSLLFNWLFRN